MIDLIQFLHFPHQHSFALHWIICAVMLHESFSSEVDFVCLVNPGTYCLRISLQLLHWRIGVVYSILLSIPQYQLLLLVFWTRTWVIRHYSSIQNYMERAIDRRATTCTSSGSQWSTHSGKVLFSSMYLYLPMGGALLTYGAWEASLKKI